VTPLRLLFSHSTMVWYRRVVEKEKEEKKEKEVDITIC
jgi:hypothetical protein